MLLGERLTFFYDYTINEIQLLVDQWVKETLEKLNEEQHKEN